MNKGEICQELVEEYLETHQPELLDKLVKNMEGLVKSIIYNYRKRPDYDDIYQVAWLTIMKCVQLYDITSGVKFTTYCYSAIVREIRQYIKKENKFKSIYDEEGNYIRGIISLESYVSSSDNSILTSELLQDNSVDIEKDSIKKILIPDVKRIIKSFSSDTQQDILHYYLQGKKQNWIAKKLNVSCGYVSRIIKMFNEKCKLELNK